MTSALVDILWRRHTDEVALYFGHDREWWEKAVQYYRAANIDTSLPDPFFPARFWESAFHAEKADQTHYFAMNLLEYWERHPSQAEMLLP